MEDIELTVSRMRAEHIPDVLLIERKSFSVPWSEASFHLELYNPLSRSYVALQGDAVVGYIITTRVVDEGHILNLAVHPDYRRAGIARALVEKGMEDFISDGCRRAYLEVRASNQAAKALYEGFGFRVIGTRRGYYIRPAEDALVMELDI